MTSKILMAVIKSFRVLKISTKKCSVSIITTFAENSVRFMFTKTFLRVELFDFMDFEMSDS